MAVFLIINTVTSQIGRHFRTLLRTRCKCESLRRCHTQDSLITVREENGVRNIVMTSPKTRNSLSIPMMDALMGAMKNLTDPALRCIVISSNGPVFSSGHNLKDLAKGEEKSYLETFSKCGDLMMQIIEAPVPVIATVNGVAAAAGCQLVATCDIVIATERSSFSTPGANFGIFCSTPGIALVRTVNKKAAARMLLTGEPIPCPEALRVGLVSVMCKEDELAAELEKHIQAIKSKSRSVVALGKKFFYEQMEKDVRSAYSLGTRVMTYNLLLADGQEGIKSFAEKRSPVWRNDFTKGAT
ncbi:UNVERIFIED_CONTAM: hypothetical protein PYX00_000186 [Menopon gallinae]|uniref:Enoyl-CoA hydratase domain-containing protein 3, mitochondrial n=1 Tax=Menopon gallinae TaxID=328185 RepID=A0AAW2I874_9NEOP